MFDKDKRIPEDIFIAHYQGNGQHNKVAILTTDGTEDQEFFYPYYRFIEEGFDVDVLTPDGGEFKGKNGAGLQTTRKIEDASASDYMMLYVPGGKAPAKLKKEDEVVSFVRDFAKTGRTIFAICHGPQLLAEAGVIKGRKIVAWPECDKEVEEAGATYVNGECVHDGQFITGRWPADLPATVKAALQALKVAAHGERRVA